MRERELFEASMARLRQKVGVQAGKELYLIYKEATEWLIEDGWGNITLSAINHRFSRKIRASTVREVKAGQSSG